MSTRVRLGDVSPITNPNPSNEADQRIARLLPAIAELATVAVYSQGELRRDWKEVLPVFEAYSSRLTEQTKGAEKLVKELRDRWG